MRGAERVVFALAALGEAGQSAALAQGADAVAAAGQDLVRIGLVADVPDQPVARGVEHVVQGNGQLDDAEAGAEMAACHRHGVDGFLAQFVDDLGQVGFREAPQVLGRLDGVEQGRSGGFGHICSWRSAANALKTLPVELCSPHRHYSPMLQAKWRLSVAGALLPSPHSSWGKG